MAPNPNMPELYYAQPYSPKWAERFGYNTGYVTSQIVAGEVSLMITTDMGYSEPINKAENQSSFATQRPLKRNLDCTLTPIDPPVGYQLLDTWYSVTGTVEVCYQGSLTLYGDSYSGAEIYITADLGEWYFCRVKEQGQIDVN